MFKKVLRFKGSAHQVILFLALILVFSISLVDAAEKPIRLKFSAFFTQNVPSGVMAIEFCRQLEEASGGRVKIDILWAGALGQSQEQLDVVRDGLGDLALHFPVYTSARTPLSLFMELPFFASSGWAGTEIAVELVRRKLITNEYEQSDVKLVCPLAYPPSQLYSNKRIMKAEDFKGVRIWSAGPVMAKTLPFIGASGISLGWSDLYTGLQRGTLDAFATTWGAGKGLKLFEVVKYPISMDLMGGYIGVLIMNKTSWNKLPPDIQSKWEKAGEKFALNYSKIMDRDELRDKKVWGEHGIEILKFSSEERERLAEKLVPVWEWWIKKHEAQGLPAKHIYKTYVEVLKRLDKPILVKVPGLYQ